MNNPSQHQPLLFSDLMRLTVGKISATLVLFTFLSFISISAYAGGAVKPLGNKALKKIEARYGKDTKKLFSGKGNEQNVLALKRLIAENIDPDLAITAIVQYDGAKKLRSGSVKKRNALSKIGQLFSGSSLSSSKGLKIIMAAGSAIAARQSNTELMTFHDSKMPVCSSKVTLTRRASKVRHQDLDKLADRVILSDLDGQTEHTMLAVAR